MMMLMIIFHLNIKHLFGHSHYGLGLYTYLVDKKYIHKWGKNIINQERFPLVVSTGHVD